jgi:hypothetical protein
VKLGSATLIGQALPPLSHQSPYPRLQQLLIPQFSFHTFQRSTANSRVNRLPIFKFRAIPSSQLDGCYRETREANTADYGPLRLVLFMRSRECCTTGLRHATVIQYPRFRALEYLCNDVPRSTSLSNQCLLTALKVLKTFGTLITGYAGGGVTFIEFAVV